MQVLIIPFHTFPSFADGGLLAECALEIRSQDSERRYPYHGPNSKVIKDGPNVDIRKPNHTASITLDKTILYGASTADYGFTRDGKIFKYDLKSTTRKPPTPSPIVTGTFETSVLAVYPNPVSDEFRIEGLGGELLTARVFDTSGRPLRCEFIKDGTGYLADVRTLVNGVYVLRVSTTKREYIVKFIKR